MTEPRTLAGKAGRHLLFALGCVLVALGAVGLFLPLLPGTLFLILAATCFARSSPRFEAWLLAHPRFGPGVSAWRRDRAIPVRAKVLALSAMGVSLGAVWYSQPPAGLLAATAAVMAGAAVYVATRPSKPLTPP